MDLGTLHGRGRREREIALHSAIHNRFVGTGGISPHRNVGDLPHDWSSERFTVVEVGNGEMAFYNRHHNRFLQMAAHHVGHSGHPPNPPKLPSGWGWERFRVVAAERILLPGTTIALHSQIHNRFAQMHGGNMGRSADKGAMEIPDGWSWERFIVVDAGHGQIALHNAVHNRFVGVGAASPHRLVDQLPGAGPPRSGRCGRLGTANRPLQHTPQPDASNDRSHDGRQWPHGSTSLARWMDLGTFPGGPCEAISSAGYYGGPSLSASRPLPSHVSWCSTGPSAGEGEPHSEPHSEQHIPFRRTRRTRRIRRLFGGGISSFDPFGAIARAAEEEARRQQAEAEERARQLALRGTIGRSAPRGVDNFPDSWTYERFTVIDAGNGQVAFHNSLHNRYLKMDGPRMLVSSPMAPDAYPSGWTWERFTVIPAGHGQFVFHNSAHNRMVRMTTDKADSSSHMNPQDLPGGWTWERFQIVPVRPYLQPGTVVALHCGIHNRYVSMNGAELQRSEVRNLNDLPSNWVWERFTVVDAGNGQVAFHNAAHNRFIQMRGAALGSTDPRGASDFQSSWDMGALHGGACGSRPVCVPQHPSQPHDSHVLPQHGQQQPHGDSGPAIRVDLGALPHRSSFRIQ